MGRIRTRGAASTGAGRLRRRRLVLAATAVALLAGATAALPASAEDEDFGYAQMEIWSGWSYEIEYGQSVELYGALSDLSQSCLTFPLDCDRPEGTLTFSGADHTIDYGQTGMTYSGGDPRGSFAVWNHVIPADRFTPGTRYVVIDYAGNFDEFTTYVEVKVRKQACHAFSVSPSTYGSKPGQPVTLTADLGSVGHTGTVAIYDPQGLIASGPVTDGRSFSTTTSAFPQGENFFYATYSGDGYHEGCTSGYGMTTVSPDANPTARDDFASTSVGVPVGIDVLANDADDNPGIRSEISNDPDFGDFEKIGETYWYTPDPDMGNYQDSFDYFLYDSIGQSSAEAHVVITVGCTPYAADDQYGTRAYSQLDVPAPSGVQRNDSACDQTVSLASGPTHGTLDLEPDGSFSYVPEAGWTGIDSFTYQYTDLLESPITGRAEIKVTPLLANPSPLPPLEGSTTTTTTTSTTTAPTSTTSTTEPPTSTSTSTTSTSTSTTSTSTTTSTTAPPTSTTSTSTTTSTTAPTTTTTTIPPTTGQVTLGSLFGLLLGRAPDPSGLAYWAPRLDSGATPADVARQLVDSAEFRRRLVDQTYTRILGRPVDAAGSAYWTDRLDREPPDALRTGLLGSNELWNRVGTDPAAWTDRAYRALLGRDATTGEHRVIDPALAGGANRGSTAARITAFDDAHRYLAELWCTALLDRSATAAEADAWGAAMAAGRSERSLVAQLAAEQAAPGS